MTKDCRARGVRCAFPTFNVLLKGPTLADQMPSMMTFPYKTNDGGTFNSICPCCYRTVASGMEELQLAEFERSHICEDASYARPISPERIVRSRMT
jgi:hypothetical protein